MLRRLRCLLHKRDVGLIQETHLAAMDDFTLRKAFPLFDIYRSTLFVVYSLLRLTVRRKKLQSDVAENKQQTWGLSQ